MTVRRLSVVLGSLLRAALLLMAVSVSMPTAKQASALYPGRLTERAKANAAKHPWAGEPRQDIVEQADYWKKLSGEPLWD